MKRITLNNLDLLPKHKKAIMECVKLLVANADLDKVTDLIEGLGLFPLQKVAIGVLINTLAELEIDNEFTMPPSEVMGAIGVLTGKSVMDDYTKIAEIHTALIRQLLGYIWACDDHGIGYIQACAKGKEMYGRYDLPDEVWSAICIGSISSYEELKGVSQTYTDQVVRKSAETLARYFKENV